VFLKRRSIQERSLRAISLTFLAGTLLLGASCASPCSEPSADGVYAFTPDERSAPPALARNPIKAAVLRDLKKDETALDFVVKSRIYPEDPNSLFLTLRGGGVSVYDVTEPGQPKLVGRAAPEDDVEGQDRLGDLLVIAARNGRLLTFDVSDRTAIRKLGELELDTAPGLGARFRGAVLDAIGSGPFDALHTMIYQPSEGVTLAMVTSPNSRELIAVDVSDPAEPRQVGAVDTKISFVEAIYVKDHHAFVGGFGTSEAFTVIDISNPSEMKIVKTLSDPAYRQLVAALAPERPNTLFVALWDDPGGLGAFDVTHPAEFTEIGRLTLPELRRANRVKLAGDYAYLPLEQKPGGFAVVDISRPDDLRLAVAVCGIRDVTMPYTLQVNGDWLYVFGTREASMAVFELLREATPK
jgi:hypothetical protein